MGETQQVQLQIMGQEVEAANPPKNTNMRESNQLTLPPLKNFMWWLKISIYTFFLIAGQTVATILGRLYFEKGGKSNWMSSLVQAAGFPVIILFYLLSPLHNSNSTPNANPTNKLNSPSKLKLCLLYVVFGIFLAANSLLYSLGLLYLPVSTYTLICASQLAFNAFFSFFLNSQKFTPFIINSIVLLTISSVLLVFQNDSTQSKEVSKGKYAIGFLCTLGASAGYGLMLSSTQFCFNKVFKQENFKVVLDMILYPSIVATVAVTIGLFATGEWKGLTKEMEEFELGQVSYVMTLIWIAICWQAFSVGCVGLIFEVSSLFSNIISTLGLPIVPVLAVFVFQEKINGLKVISMLMAIWGFISYAYQHYLDDYKSKTDVSSGDLEIL